MCLFFSIVIPTINKPEHLKNCLWSIFKQTILPKEIVVVDASSDKNFNRNKKSIHSFDNQNIKTKHLHAKPGLTQQKNIGIKVSSEDLILFLDDDIILDPNFLFHIRTVFVKDKINSVGGVMGRIVSRRSRHFRLMKWFNKFFLLTSEGNDGLKSSGLPTHPFSLNYNRPIPVKILSGGLTAFRREVFKHEMFDETLVGYSYMEDVDFSYRVSQKYKVIYQPKALVKHMVTSTNNINKRERKKMFAINHFYLFKKNCQPSFINWLAFIWAQIGQLIKSLILFDKESICGLLEGWWVNIKTLVIRKK